MMTSIQEYLPYIGTVIVLFLILAVFIIFSYYSKKYLKFKLHADDSLIINVNDSKVYSNTSLYWTDPHEGSIPVNHGDIVTFIVKNRGSTGGLIGEFKWNGKTYYTTPDVFKDKVVNEFLNDNTPSITKLFPKSKWLWIPLVNNCNDCEIKFIWTVPM